MGKGGSESPESIPIVEEDFEEELVSMLLELSARGLDGLLGPAWALMLSAGDRSWFHRLT